MDRYDVSLDSGEYLPNDETLDDSAFASKPVDPESYRTPPSARSRESEPLYPMTENLINGGHQTDHAEPDIIPTHSASAAQTPTGVSKSPRVSERRRLPSNQEPKVNGISRSSSPDVRKSRESLPKESVRSFCFLKSIPISFVRKLVKIMVIFLQAPKKSNTLGVGDLPLPCFSLESAGVMPTGSIDDSVKLSTSDRAEKVIKIGVVCSFFVFCLFYLCILACSFCNHFT